MTQKSNEVMCHTQEKSISRAKSQCPERPGHRTQLIKTQSTFKEPKQTCLKAKGKCGTYLTKQNLSEEVSAVVTVLELKNTGPEVKTLLEGFHSCLEREKGESEPE
jgi:hypothetical protein